MWSIHAIDPPPVPIDVRSTTGVASGYIPIIGRRANCSRRRRRCRRRSSCRRRRWPPRCACPSRRPRSQRRGHPADWPGIQRVDGRARDARASRTPPLVCVTTNRPVKPSSAKRCAEPFDVARHQRCDVRVQQHGDAAFVLADARCDLVRQRHVHRGNSSATISASRNSWRGSITDHNSEIATASTRRRPADESTTASCASSSCCKHLAVGVDAFAHADDAAARQQHRRLVPMRGFGAVLLVDADHLVALGDRHRRFEAGGGEQSDPGARAGEQRVDAGRRGVGDQLGIGDRRRPRRAERRRRPIDRVEDALAQIVLGRQRLAHADAPARREDHRVGERAPPCRPRCDTRQPVRRLQQDAEEQRRPPNSARRRRPTTRARAWCAPACAGTRRRRRARRTSA